LLFLPGPSERLHTATLRECVGVSVGGEDVGVRHAPIRESRFRDSRPRSCTETETLGKRDSRFNRDSRFPRLGFGACLVGVSEEELRRKRHTPALRECASECGSVTSPLVAPYLRNYPATSQCSGKFPSQRGANKGETAIRHSHTPGNTPTLHTLPYTPALPHTPGVSECAIFSLQKEKRHSDTPTLPHSGTFPRTPVHFRALPHSYAFRHSRALLHSYTPAFPCTPAFLCTPMTLNWVYQRSF
jgi:hypothetical protein